MEPKASNLARVALTCAAFALVTSCGVLPRVGPSKKEIFAGSVLRDGDAFIVEVDDRVNRIVSVAPALGFSSKFQNAGRIGSDTIRPGDTLGLTIWENVDVGLLAGEGQNATILEEVQVDGSGFIFVPYAGRIRASGRTPNQIRSDITSRLNEQTPDPQVQVRRVEGDGATVTILGTGGGQGVFPIQRPTRTLASMVAAAGGVAVRPDIAKITVSRGHMSETIWFNDLFSNPHYDIALRNGDRILIEEDTRTFTALGATGTQSRLEFDDQTISALEAIAQVGGLSSTLADPTGVFVFRNEPEALAAQVVGRADLRGTQRFVYVLNLTKPNGMFMARDFAIRDQDTVYVTEAPFVTWNKTIAAITGSLNSATGLASAASTN